MKIIFTVILLFDLRKEFLKLIQFLIFMILALNGHMAGHFEAENLDEKVLEFSLCIFKLFNLFTQFGYEKPFLYDSVFIFFFGFSLMLCKFFSSA